MPCIGDGGIQRDLAVAQRFEDRIGEIGKTEPTAHEPLGEAEALGDVLGGFLLALDDVLEGPAGIGRVHREVEEILFQAGLRSEEHTSELQSLMRISYAVFCLKKKTPKQDKQTNVLQKLTRNNDEVLCYNT